MERSSSLYESKWNLEGGKLRASYEEDLNRLKTAQKNAAVADLENTRNQALSNLEAERSSNAALYNQQRSTANAQNRMNAKNFQEYLASTGRANSGLSSQARMQYDNNLNNSLNYLNTSQAGALADINRRQTLANDTYNSGLASANANIEANYIQSLLDQRNKELERQLQERQFQEQIRQFNENLALQREQLYSRFRSGSGGGEGDNDLSSKKTGDTVSVAVGQAEEAPTRVIGGMGIVDTPVYKINGKKYYKNAQGKLVQIK